MFFLMGQKNLLKNTILLAKQNASGPLSSLNLRQEYLSYIQKVQVKNKVCMNSSHQWIYKYEMVKPYVNLFSEKSIVNDLGQDNVIDTNIYNEAEASANLERVREAYSSLRQHLPDFCDIFNLNIHTLFSAPSAVAGGGSTSGAVGVIWANPKNHWKQNDLFEILIHEYTHNAMFIDELCHQHYVSLKEVAKSENYPISAILKKRRPLDKVLHALAVGTEILCTRQYVLGHPESPCAHPQTEILIQQTENSIRSIKELPNVSNLLKDRAKFLIERCEEEVSRVKEKYKGKANVA